MNIADQFKNVNWKDIGNTPPGPKIVTLILLLIAVVAAGWYFYWDGLNQELEEAQRKEAKLKEEYKSHRRPSPLDAMLKPQPRKPWAIKKMLVEGRLMQSCCTSKAEAAQVASILEQGVEEDEQLEVFDRPDDHDYEEDEVEEWEEEAFDLGYEDE